MSASSSSSANSDTISVAAAHIEAASLFSARAGQVWYGAAAIQAVSNFDATARLKWVKQGTASSDWSDQSLSGF
jgi:hypothetical protein